MMCDSYAPFVASWEEVVSRMKPVGIEGIDKFRQNYMRVFEPSQGQEGACAVAGIGALLSISECQLKELEDLREAGKKYKALIKKRVGKIMKLA